MSGPIEIKVPATAIGSAVSGVIIWALQTYVFPEAVPPAIDGAVQVLVPAAIGMLAGWLAPHTPRPDLQVTQADVADAHVDDDRPGDHALDGDAGEIPASQFLPPKATRFDRPR